MTEIEIREFYIGNFQTEYRAYRGNEILDKDTNRVNLVRRIAKKFGETIQGSIGNREKTRG